MDLSAGARSLVEISLALKGEETAMVVVDEDRLAIGQALVQAARQAGADAFLTVLDVSGPGMEPPEPVADAMKDCEVVILAPGHSLSHTDARRQANRSGARVLSLPHVTEAMMADGCLTANHEEVEESMARAYKRLRRARTLRVTTPRGTDLTVSVRGQTWITDDTGLCRGRGDFATFPAGELLVAPEEGSAEGALLVDVFFQHALRAPATVTVREGYAVRVTGAQEAEAAMDAGGHEGRHLSRLGVGFNPQASLHAGSLEAQKALGVLHVGFGDNQALGGDIRSKAEVDAVLKGINLEADGKPLMERGRPLT
ncbi:MAG: aminopeptidase [Thermoplasmata archaeon]